MISCPQCGESSITAIEDYERNLVVIECERCGLAFAVRKHELYAVAPIGDEDAAHMLIQADWDMAYNSRDKLMGACDGRD